MKNIRDTRVLMTHDVCRWSSIGQSLHWRLFSPLGLSQIVSIIQTSDSVVRLFVHRRSTRPYTGWGSRIHRCRAKNDTSFRLAVTDIVNNQRVSKILVGDKHQQIYAFRGAVNAMMKIDSTVTYYLTKVRTVGETTLLTFHTLVISFWIRYRFSIEFDSAKSLPREEISRGK